MLSMLSARCTRKLVGYFPIMSMLKTALNDPRVPSVMEPWNSHGLSGEVVKTKKTGTRVKLRDAAKKFLQDAEPPKVLAEFPELEKMGTMKEKYGVRFQDMFAVIQLGSHQFKVTSDDVIYTEKLKDVDVMDKVKLQRVLLIGSKDTTTIGRPFIPGASVWACVEEQCQDAKVIIFKKKRRKNYRKTQGHRQELTGLRILDISYPKPQQDRPIDKKVAVEKEVADNTTQMAQSS